MNLVSSPVPTNEPHFLFQRKVEDMQNCENVYKRTRLQIFYSSLDKLCRKKKKNKEGK